MSPNSDDRALLVPAPAAIVQFAGSDGVRVSVDGRIFSLSRDDGVMLMQFADGRTMADVYEQAGTGRSKAAFISVVLQWVAAGILCPLGKVATAAPHKPIPTILEYLNPKIFGDASITKGISVHLRADRLVHVRNAMREDVATRVYEALRTCENWKPQEVHQSFFHYKHHNLYAAKDFPDDVAECCAVLDNRATKDLLSQLSGDDCLGPIQFGASQYLPGDYSLPHSDSNRNRSVAFVWHLTESWNPRWGGSLVWCQTGTSILPGFNCLTLFKVSTRSVHFVAPVAALAQGRRLAVNGWWCRVHSDAAAAMEQPPTRTQDESISLSAYGPPSEVLEECADVTIL